MNGKHAERQDERYHQHTREQATVQFMERLLAHEQAIKEKEADQYQGNLKLIGKELRSDSGLGCKKDIHWKSN